MDKSAEPQMDANAHGGGGIRVAWRSFVVEIKS
jgi:hypothetical protein